MAEIPAISRADRIHRVLARFIDILIASALWRILQNPVGIVAAATYLLIADGLPPNGQSLGKRLIGLKVVVQPGSAKCAWRQSMVRNIPFALLMVASALGYFGFLVGLAALLVIGFECYFVFTDPQGLRLGDVFANTKVLDG
jgi:uncharacterized RDD family membrane protein YckC